MKGTITLGAKIDKDDSKSIQIWVADTGVGIKDEVKSKLINALSANDTKLNPHWVGLGLAISNNLVRALNNSDEGLQFESECGKGTTFWFKVRIFEDKDQGTRRLSIPEEIAREDSRPLYVMSPNHHKKAIIIPENKGLQRIKKTGSKSCGVVPKKDKYVLLVDDNPFNWITPSSW